MRKYIFLTLMLAAAVALAACGTVRESGAADEEETAMLWMKIDDEEVKVVWEDNQSVKALKAAATEETLSIDMAMYGGFEQVGPIGRELPSEDEQMSTGAGDIVLYSGDQLALFYGSNSWAYTRLGHISGKSPEELEELLGRGDVTVYIGAKEKE